MITTRSETLFQQAGKHLAGGVGSGTRSPRSGWLPAPVFVRSGEGAWLTDEDDNRYLDYVMGQGPLILGHRPAAVIDEVTRTLEQRGSLVSLAHDLEGEAAAAITDRMPAVDLVRFSSTGTEAAMYALRFARAFTGRDLVLRFEGHYHGWSDAIHWSAHPTAGHVGRRRRADGATRVDRHPRRRRRDAAGRALERRRGAGAGLRGATAIGSRR